MANFLEKYKLSKLMKEIVKYEQTTNDEDYEGN